MRKWDLLRFERGEPLSFLFIFSFLWGGGCIPARERIEKILPFRGEKIKTTRYHGGEGDRKGEDAVAAKRTGRKPWYNSPEEMEEKIEAYFKDCEGHMLFEDDGKPYIDKWGNPIVIGAHPPTVTGLALALGFTSRQALLNYQAKKAFVDTVTRAKSRIEEYAERRLYDRDGARGAEFTLKYNFKWAAEEKENAEEGGGVVLLAPVMEAPAEPPDPYAEDGGDK